MEHLFYDLDDEYIADKVSSALNSDILRENQHEVSMKLSLMPLVQPMTKWYGYNDDNVLHNSFGVQVDLADWPTVRGWDVDAWWDRGELRKAHTSLEDVAISPTEVGQRVAAMVQNWLYFGFLEAVLGKKVHNSYLLCNDERGVLTIHSGNIAFAFMAWKIDLWGRREPAVVKEIYDRTYDNFLVVAGAIQKLTLWTDSTTKPGIYTREHFPGFCELVTALLPAINRLADVMCTVRDQVHTASGDRMVVMTGLPDAIAEREIRLVQRGWCPFMIKTLELKLHYSVLDWLDGSAMHESSGGHELCDGKRCVRNNIDTASYKPRHCTESCDCRFIAPKLEDVLVAIDEGSIPVIRMQNDLRAELEVIKQPVDRLGNYVAISHVWVDGLGSTSEVGLPTCQVKRLGESVQKATTDSSILFWIDSLCIPSASEQRKKSIRQLRNIYRNAASVMVIDREIRRCPRDASAERLLWTIASSPWMQRLWTYQEGYLATRVLFQVQGKSLIEIDQQWPSSTLPTSAQVVRTSLIQHLNNLRPDNGLPDVERKTNLGEVASAISWRSTSKSGDEVLAIAALLNLDTRSLTALPIEERMRGFYLSVGTLPHDIIFYDGPRLPRPFRWAPASLMTRSEIAIDDTAEGQNALCSSEGLKCRYLVLCFDDIVRGEDDVCYYVFESSDHALYSIQWVSDYKNVPLSPFNGVIMRSIQHGSVLKPELTVVVEGIAVASKKGAPGQTVAAYAGRVTVLKRARDERSEQPEKTHPSILRGLWQTIDLLIT
ncbi:MAG: hypothetical protein Q9195_006602 [Heterodermia aff. obscurata]